MPSQPSPDLFFQTLNAYQRTAALKAAIELALFSAIAAGQTTVSQLALTCQVSERGIRILCDYLVILGFLTKTEQSYGLTPESALFLDQQSPAYLGGMVNFLGSSTITQAFQDVAAVVRQGGTVLGAAGTLDPEHPVWVDFAQSMMPMMAMPAQKTAELVDSDANQPLKVLDIAASHGLFGIAFAQRNPQAQITALDWANVVTLAKTNAEKMGVGDRLQTIAGSAFDVDFGDRYDVVLLPNFLHHFDVATCEQLLRKIRTALTPQGRVATLEFIPNGDRVSPPTSASFALTMLCSTPQGDAYTFAEYEQMFDRAGFATSTLYELPPAEQRLIISSL